MGLFDLLRGRSTKVIVQPDDTRYVATMKDPTEDAKRELAKGVAIGAGKENDATQIQSFNNSNFTFNGELQNFNYVGILRDKQSNIQQFYQLADYYTDADPIVHGIVKHVYVPYSTCSDWYLTGSKEKTYALYQEQYKRMRLREKIDAIMLEIWKYGNVCCYLKDGDLITLPVTKWKIGNTMFNGTPIVDYDCQSIINEIQQKGYSIKEEYAKDSDTEYILKGYPEEIQKAVKAGQQYAQLNPENSFEIPAAVRYEDITSVRPKAFIWYNKGRDYDKSYIKFRCTNGKKRCIRKFTGNRLFVSRKKSNEDNRKVFGEVSEQLKKHCPHAKFIEN